MNSQKSNWYLGLFDGLLVNADERKKPGDQQNRASQKRQKAMAYKQPFEN